MSLPTVAPYALPRPDELPPSRVDWTLEPERAALLIHDMQRYFVAAFGGQASPIGTVIRTIDGLRRRCAAMGIPVFYTAPRGGQDPRDRGLQQDFWGRGMAATADHEAIVPPLKPASDDIVLTKWRYSAFQRTPLEEMMRARGRNQLIVTGVYAHIGCLLTAADAFMRDIQPFFVADGVADFSREKHDAALAYVAGVCGSVISGDALRLKTD